MLTAILQKSQIVTSIVVICFPDVFLSCTARQQIETTQQYEDV